MATLRTRGEPSSRSGPSGRLRCDCEVRLKLPIPRRSTSRRRMYWVTRRSRNASRRVRPPYTAASRLQTRCTCERGGRCLSCRPFLVQPEAEGACQVWRDTALRAQSLESSNEEDGPGDSRPLFLNVCRFLNINYGKFRTTTRNSIRNTSYSTALRYTVAYILFLCIKTILLPRLLEPPQPLAARAAACAVFEAVAV